MAHPGGDIYEQGGEGVAGPLRLSRPRIRRRAAGQDIPLVLRAGAAHVPRERGARARVFDLRRRRPGQDGAARPRRTGDRPKTVPAAGPAGRNLRSKKPDGGAGGVRIDRRDLPARGGGTGIRAVRDGVEIRQLGGLRRPAPEGVPGAGRKPRSTGAVPGPLRVPIGR